MATATTIKAGRSPTGYYVRVEGRGTLRESPAVAAFADEVLAASNSDLTLDLSTCDYLDSTFLGCLVSLHRRFGQMDPPRMRIVMAPESRQRMLASTHLDHLLNLTVDAPVPLGEEVVLVGGDLSAVEMCRHVLDCHRQLVELGGRNAEVYTPVVERLARDLQRRQPG